MSDNREYNEGSLEITASIVSAYVSNNNIPLALLPELLASVHQALQSLKSPAAAPEPEPQKPTVPVKKSVTPDYLISLEDGRPYKSLKQHLRRRYGMTPEQYRAKWNLPAEYPMVAPNYANKRSEIAKTLGLGRKVGTKIVTKRSRIHKAMK